MARLGDVCTVVSGTTPKSDHPEYWDGEINWVTPAELTDDSNIIRFMAQAALLLMWIFISKKSLILQL